MDSQSFATNCGQLWIANSIVSTVMTTTNCNIREEAAQRNLYFQLELEDARNIAQDEIEAEKIAFKRRVLELSRQYRQTESAKTFEQQLNMIELRSFIEKYWPLAGELPSIFIKKIEESKNCNIPLPLNILLLRTPLLPTPNTHSRDNDIYNELEYKLNKSLRTLCNIEYWKDCCDNAKSTYSNANIMNIHFLLGSLPTLVIFPKCNDEGKMIFNAATWEAQAPYPLMRPLFSIDYAPLSAERNEEYLSVAIERIETALTIIVGVIRDSYFLLTQGKAPMLSNILDERKKAIIEKDKTLKAFVKQEYEDIINALDLKRSPKLLEAYSKEDVESMRLHAHNMSLTF